MPEFLGMTNIEWVGINVIANIAGIMFISLTLLLALLQVKQAAHSFRFSAVNRLQELFDDFREDRTQLFRLPLDIALQHHQFSSKPPHLASKTYTSEGNQRKMSLTLEQHSALNKLTVDEIELVRKIIIRLNDIGQLVEEGFIPKGVFFGKYHLLVLRCCHMVEAVRRNIEKEEGGNFGQRLLRLRKRAIKYHNTNPKQRDTSVYVSNKSCRVLIYEPSDNFLLNIFIHPLNRVIKNY